MEELKEELKEEPKEELKEDLKEDLKEELKEDLKEEKMDYYSIVIKNIKTMRKKLRVLCNQVGIIFLLLLL